MQLDGHLDRLRFDTSGSLNNGAFAEMAAK